MKLFLYRALLTLSVNCIRIYVVCALTGYYARDTGPCAAQRSVNQEKAAFDAFIII